MSLLASSRLSLDSKSSRLRSAAVLGSLSVVALAILFSEATKLVVAVLMPIPSLMPLHYRQLPDQSAQVYALLCVCRVDGQFSNIVTITCKAAKIRVQ